MAFVIDPQTRCVRVCGLDDNELDALKTSDPILLNADTGDVIYQSSNSNYYFVIDGIRKPLQGPSIIVGTTEDGDDCEPQATLEWVQQNLDFGTANAGMYFGDTIVRALQG